MNFPYHRLARSAPRYRWWKAIVTGLIALGFFLVLSLIVAVVYLVVEIVTVRDPAKLFQLAANFTIDYTSPGLLALTLISVAVMLPSIWFARMIMGPRPAGLLLSVAGRIRWRWMSRLILPVVIAYGLSYLVTAFLPGGGFAPPRITATTWGVVILSVLLVPVQAAAEELVFRGYLMQAIGGWLKHPLFAILIPVPLFALAHPQYDIWGVLDVAVFALSATYLTWRTGGIEASLMAHAVNNTVIFVLGAFGLVDSNSTTGSPFEVLISALTLGLYVLLVLYAAGRFGLERTRSVEQVDPPAWRYEPQPYPDAAAPVAAAPVAPAAAPLMAPGVTPGAPPRTPAVGAWTPPAG